MLTAMEFENLRNMATQHSHELAERLATINNESFRSMHEKNAEDHRKMMDYIIKEMQSLDEKTHRREAKRILAEDIPKPEPFAVPTNYMSIDRFVKQYSFYLKLIWDGDKGACAEYLRFYLEGQAAHWYDLEVDGKDIADNFDDVIAAMRKRFRRESRKAYYFTPLQNDQTVTEFYDELVKIAAGQMWPADHQLELFESGISDEYKKYLEVRNPKTLAEAYDIALIIEADRSVKETKCENENESECGQIQEVTSSQHRSAEGINNLARSVLQLAERLRKMRTSAEPPAAPPAVLPDPYYTTQQNGPYSYRDSYPPQYYPRRTNYYYYN